MIASIGSEMRLDIGREAVARFDAEWKRIPAAKREKARSAYAVLMSADALLVPRPADRDDPPDTTRLDAYWEQGMAHRLICAVDSMADCYFGGNRRAAVIFSDKMADWFTAHGLARPGRSVEDAYAIAVRRHNNGVALMEAIRNDLQKKAEKNGRQNIKKNANANESERQDNEQRND